MTSKTYVFVTVIATAFGVGAASAQPQSAGGATGDVLMAAPSPQAPPSDNGAGMTTKCKFDKGPKAGTTFDFKVLGLHQIPVGVECQDGMGSSGISVP